MDKNRMMDMLLELCHVPSITESAAENEMPQKLSDMLNRIQYFKDHPENIKVHKISEDPLGRSFIFALMKADVKCSKTVILLSHFDVVGVDGFGSLKDLAFDPVKYTEQLKCSSNIDLPDDAKKDLESGDYLFGRGTMDMKFGIAAGIEALYQIQENYKSLNVNILFVSVPDEEANSTGMLAAVKELKRLKDSEDLEYAGCIVTEPQFPKYPGDTSKYIYTGTVGKLLPVFYCVGKETHVGEPFAGLNPNLLTAAIIEGIEQNPDLADAYEGIYAPSPVCLKQSDTKENYSVQTPMAAYTYFNYLTLHSSPDEVMDKMKKIAADVFEKVMESISQKAERIAVLTGNKPDLPQFQPKVYTYEELYDICLEKHGSVFEEHMKQFIKNSKAEDLRVLSIDMVKEVHSFCPDRNPMIILFFSPPFYPHAELHERDKHVLEISKKIVDIADKEFGEKIYCDPFINGLSDVCYLSLPKRLNIESLKRNIPLWDSRYSVPLDIISQLNIPYINLSPFGKDAHKSTERLNVPFSFNVAAKLLLRAIMLMAG